MSVKYFSTPRIDSGRLGFGLGLVAKGLPANTPDYLRARLDEAQAAAATWFDTQERYTQQRKGNRRRGETQVIDRAADALLGKVHQICVALALLGEENPEGKAAQAFIARFFPDGLGAITQLNFESQLQAMERMRDAFGQAPARNWIVALPIDGLLVELVALLPSYRSELERSNEKVTAVDVRATERAARDLLEQVIGGLRCHFGADFEAVIAPLSAQVRRFRAALNQSRTPPPVDPQTGEPVDESSESDAD